MRLAILGDIHGEFLVLDKILCRNQEQDTFDAIIQVGDFGIYPSLFPGLITFDVSIPIYFVDGNHEHFPYLKSLQVPENKRDDGTYEIYPNIFYVPRGTMLMFGEKKFGFVGGASSVDRYWRTKNVSWWYDENIDDYLIVELIEKWSAAPIDYLITHQPTKTAINGYFPPINRSSWGLPEDWIDLNAERIDKLWKNIGYPHIISGHMHKHIFEPWGKILDINEVATIYV